ncbi:biotin--[acetyl-CoA-carboxylase] ligase [Actinospongicola halichondriae]|uniref:biotin--[acetyl-CoA-carboxylase] ligase n=1 Tax=Actinospongicola halichondriae TaxID=3236844 RepID=UPI003D54E7ED
MAETGSTNADVMTLAREGAPEGVVVVADHQTAGRGRAGRTWTAPPRASLLCTVLLRPPAPVAPLVTFALSVAAAEAVAEVAGFWPGLKWPNDLVVEAADGTTKKLAGILAEAEWPAGSSIAAGYRQPPAHERATVAAGIGLNVDWPDDVPDELADIAVAINHVTGRRLSTDVVLEALLDRLDVHYGRLVSGGAADVLTSWRERSSTLGQRVRVDLGADDVVGTAVDVTAEGHLVVETLEGERRTIAVGDVVHLRSAG